MIAIEKLRTVTTIVAHQNGAANACADGTAAALLCADALPHARVLFASHAGPELRDLRPGPGLLFVDIAPPRERAADFLAAGAIVLDHHERQQDVVQPFVDAGLGVFGDTSVGESGAVLAYRYVWFALKDPAARFDGRAGAFARLAGVRDCWLKADPGWTEACEQAEALRFHPFADLRAVEVPFGFGDPLKALLDVVGPTLWRQKLARAKDTARKALWLDAAGDRVAVVPTLETSDAADELDGADVVVGFGYAAREGAVRLQLSFRTRTGRDVGAIAARLGGGGHREAAGATIEHREDESPYAAVRRVLGGRS